MYRKNSSDSLFLFLFYFIIFDVFGQFVKRPRETTCAVVLASAMMLAVFYFIPAPWLGVSTACFLVLSTACVVGLTVLEVAKFCCKSFDSPDCNEKNDCSQKKTPEISETKNDVSLNIDNAEKESLGGGKEKAVGHTL